MAATHDDQAAAQECRGSESAHDHRSVAENIFAGDQTEDHGRFGSAVCFAHPDRLGPNCIPRGIKDGKRGRGALHATARPDYPLAHSLRNERRGFAIDIVSRAAMSPGGGLQRRRRSRSHHVVQNSSSTRDGANRSAAAARLRAAAARPRAGAVRTRRDRERQRWAALVTSPARRRTFPSPRGPGGTISAGQAARGPAFPPQDPSSRGRA